MLEIKPICENCGRSLPNESDEAMICSFECTFCSDCVTSILHNVCPNCGGGFEKRPTRPNKSLVAYPAGIEKKYKPVVMGKFIPLLDTFKDIDPRKR
jgi:hypothetical protein